VDLVEQPGVEALLDRVGARPPKRRFTSPPQLPFRRTEGYGGTSGRFFDGPTPTTEVEVLLATHGWWPWLLMYALILAGVVYGVMYVVKRRRAG